MIQMVVKKPTFSWSDQITLQTSVQCSQDTKSSEPDKEYFQHELFSDEFREFRLEKITGNTSTDSIQFSQFVFGSSYGHIKVPADVKGS